MPETLSSTLKQRVEQFWKWFPTVSQLYFDALEQNKLDSLVEEFSQHMSSYLHDMAWVFGPGPTEDSHSLTVSGECLAVKQLVARYWLDCAIEVPGWSFYSSRQPTEPEKLAGMELTVGKEKSIDTVNFLLKVRIDEENQIFDLRAWHESFRVVPRSHHEEILFLLLDEALGEFGASMWLGDVAIKPIKPEKATVNLVNLRSHLQKIIDEKGWQRLPPLEEYAVYELPERGDFPRGDTICGISCIPEAIFELIENRGALQTDLLDGTGAELVYIQIDSDALPVDKEAEFRAEVEDLLEERLRETKSGYTLGGAYGASYSYIDLILFDGDESRKLVKSQLSTLNLADRSRLVSFC